MVLVIALLLAAACFVALAPLRPDHGDGAPPVLHLPSFVQRRLADQALPVSPAQYLTLWLLVPSGTVLAVRLVTGAWLTGLLCLPAGALICSAALDHLSRRRTQLLRDQLQEALLSLTTSLKAGQALPTALERAVAELRRLYPRGAPLLQELDLVVREVQMGAPVDQALLILRDRLPLDEVASLVDALVISRRRGGNIVAVMGNVTHLLADRMAVDREIRVMTAQKRAEATILALLPLGIYLINRVGSPAYLAVFHETAGGQLTLGLIFLTIAVGHWLALRLARIDV